MRENHFSFLLAFILCITTSASALSLNDRYHIVSIFPEVDQSDLILLAECSGYSEETTKLRYKNRPDTIFAAPKYAYFKVYESWKTDYSDSNYTLDLTGLELISKGVEIYKEVA